MPEIAASAHGLSLVKGVNKLLTQCGDNHSVTVFAPTNDAWLEAFELSHAIALRYHDKINRLAPLDEQSNWLLSHVLEGVDMKGENNTQNPPPQQGQPQANQTGVNVTSPCNALNRSATSAVQLIRYFVADQIYHVNNKIGVRLRSIWLMCTFSHSLTLFRGLFVVGSPSLLGCQR